MKDVQKTLMIKLACIKVLCTLPNHFGNRGYCKSFVEHHVKLKMINHNLISFLNKQKLFCFVSGGE